MADLVKENGRKLIIDGGACYTGGHVKYVKSDTPGFLKASEHMYSLSVLGEPGYTVHLTEVEMLDTIAAWMVDFNARRKQAAREIARQQEQHRCKQETSKTKSVS